jgi:hypothetical protein
MSGRTIPACVIRACPCRRGTAEVAAELVGLFDRDPELALALNEASDRLQRGTISSPPAYPRRRCVRSTVRPALRLDYRPF